MPEPHEEAPTLTDEEIETRAVGGAHAPRLADTGDTDDTSDTGDDSGDPTDTSDAGDRGDDS